MSSIARGIARETNLDLSGLIAPVFPAPVQALCESLAARLLGLKHLQQVYAEVAHLHNPCEFACAALAHLGVRFDVQPQEQFNIPMSGPAVVVANHPFGGLEGLFMVWLLRCLRNDVRLLANSHLGRIPVLRESFIPVDPFGGRRAARENGAAARQALHWVKDGGLLAVFPAGEVAHFDARSGAICEAPWNPGTARLIRMAGAPVVPVHFDGRNSLRFQLAGLAHPRLRTLLLPRELLNKDGVEVKVRIGQPIPFNKFAAVEDDDALAVHLRVKTQVLATPRPAATAAHKRDKHEAAGRSADGPAPQPIAAPIPAQRIAEEIARLPAGQRLAASGDLSVHHASAQQAPWLLQEIGRLRELTFRAVGEGTGRAADVDLFDDYYEHLFIWNTASAELVGAYRLGRAGEIVARFGKRGLYTNTLFEYRGPILRQLDPALELGRSFVRPEYQKSFAALLLLWKGIGEYVVRHPRYSVLFGAVSISNDYAALSKQMLVEYLRERNYANHLARWVKARRPFRGRHHLRALARELKSFGDVDTLSALVSDIEPDGKGVPILLRQYLKLGGRLLGFNVDAAFADSIDCLIMVDLRRTDARVLNKYMGREGAQAFMAFHAGSAREPATAAKA